MASSRTKQAGAPSVTSVASELHALPRAEFVAARNARARELRTAGERARADEVKALAKPSIVAWALNAAVRGEPDAARELVELVRDLQATGDVRERGGRLDELVAVLRAAAKRGLTEAGEAAGSDRLAEVAAALRAAPLSGDVDAFLEARLAEEPRAGEDTLEAALRAGMAALPRRERIASTDARPAPVADPVDADAEAEADRARCREERRRLQTELHGAEAHATRTATALRDADRALHRAERALADAQVTRATAASAADRAATLVRELTRELADLGE